MYLAFEVPQNLRDDLAETYPPQFFEFIGHHVTEQMGVKADTPLPTDKKITVIGHLTDRCALECFLVKLDDHYMSGENVGRRYYHITWSLDRSKGKKPFHSNQMIHEYMEAGLTSDILTFTKFNKQDRHTFSAMAKARIYK